MKLRLLHRGDKMWVFLAHKKRLSLVAPTIVPASMIVSFYRRGRPAFQHESYFVGRCLPKAVATSFFFMRAFGLPRSSKILLFGPITHHAVMGDLGLFLGVTRGHNFIVISNTPCAGFSGWGTRLSSGKLNSFVR